MRNRKFKRMDNLIFHIVKVSDSTQAYLAARDLIKELDTNKEQREWYYNELHRLYEKGT